MAELREKMEADLKIAGYNPSTRKIYLLHARLFSRAKRQADSDPAANRNLTQGSWTRAAA